MTEIDTTTDHHDGLSKASYSHGTRFGCNSNGSDLSIEWSSLDICCVTVRSRRLYHTLPHEPVHKRCRLAQKVACVWHVRSLRELRDLWCSCHYELTSVVTCHRPIGTSR